MEYLQNGPTAEGLQTRPIRTAINSVQAACQSSAPVDAIHDTHCVLSDSCAPSQLRTCRMHTKARARLTPNCADDKVWMSTRHNPKHTQPRSRLTLHQRSAGTAGRDRAADGHPEEREAEAVLPGVAPSDRLLPKILRPIHELGAWPWALQRSDCARDPVESQIPDMGNAQGSLGGEREIGSRVGERRMPRKIGGLCIFLRPPRKLRPRVVVPSAPSTSITQGRPQAPKKPAAALPIKPPKRQARRTKKRRPLEY